jgi:hypothetical protein
VVVSSWDVKRTESPAIVHYYFLVISYAVHVVLGIGSTSYLPPTLILICLSAAVSILMFIVSVLVSGIGSASYDPAL